MLKTVAYFKSLAAVGMMKDVVDQCNCILSQDFGMYLRLNYSPDLLMVVKNGENSIVALLIMHFTPGTRAWEIGTMSTSKQNARDDMLALLINSACDAIRTMQGRDSMDKTVWLVKKVRHSDPNKKILFSKMGFEHPESWVENVLSDSGFIPFDPFEYFLMKKVVQT